MPSTFASEVNTLHPVLAVSVSDETQPKAGTLQHANRYCPPIPTKKTPLISDNAYYHLMGWYITKHPGESWQVSTCHPYCNTKIYTWHSGQHLVKTTWPVKEGTNPHIFQYLWGGWSAAVVFCGSGKGLCTCILQEEKQLLEGLKGP